MLADNLRYSAEYLGLELSQHGEASRLFKELLQKAHRQYDRKVKLALPPINIADFEGYYASVIYSYHGRRIRQADDR